MREMSPDELRALAAEVTGLGCSDVISDRAKALDATEAFLRQYIIAYGDLEISQAASV